MGDPEDPVSKNMALMMFQTATLRSGYMLQDANSFASNIDMMMQHTLGVSDQELEAEEEEENSAEADPSNEVEEEEEEISAEADPSNEVEEEEEEEESSAKDEL